MLTPMTAAIDNKNEMNRVLGHFWAHTGRGWWDESDGTALQTQDSKFKPWGSEADHATSRSRRLSTILILMSGWGRNIFVSFKPPRPGNEPRTLVWKAAVLTTTLRPPPPLIIVKATQSGWTQKIGDFILAFNMIIWCRLNMSIDYTCNFFFNFCAAHLPVLKTRYKDEIPVGLFFILDTHVRNKKSGILSLYL